MDKKYGIIKEKKPAPEYVKSFIINILERPAQTAVIAVLAIVSGLTIWQVNSLQTTDNRSSASERYQSADVAVGIDYTSPGTIPTDIESPEFIAYIRSNFPPGVKIYEVKVSPSDIVSAVASDEHILLINKTDSPYTVSVHGVNIPLTPRQIKLIDSPSTN